METAGYVCIGALVELEDCLDEDIGDIACLAGEQR